MDRNTLEQTITQATTTRWAWKNPTYEQANIPDERGRVLLAVRRDDLRAVCLGWEYDPKTRRLWMAWSEQQKDAGGEWQEVGRFPRLEDVRPDAKGQWRRLNYDIDEHTPEWKYLAPPALRALVANRVHD
jgi:hypothetical protein